MSIDRDALLEQMTAYASGAETKPVVELGREALRALADADDRDALYVLGCVLEREQANPIEVQTAMLRAASLGHERAMYEMACVFWGPSDEYADGLGEGSGSERLGALLEGAVPDAIHTAVAANTLAPFAKRSRAVYWLRQAALIGHANAAAELASLVFRASDKHRVAALPWFERAARAGDTQATKTLADVLFYGNGVTRDRETAEIWYRKLFTDLQAISRTPGRDNGYDLVMLGDMHRLGQGTPCDIAQAVVCWEQAADNGYEYALCKLGDLYATGADVTQDFKRAEHYFRRAIEAGDDGYAVSCLNDLPRKRLEAAEKAVAEISVETLKRLVAANDLTVFAPGRGDGPLAAIYALAGDTPFNAMSKLIVRLEEIGEPAAALALMAQSALAGNSATAINLARRYELGWNGMPEDLVATMHWLRHAACLGEPLAMMRLAERLLHAE